MADPILDIKTNYYQGCDGKVEGSEAEKEAELNRLEKTGEYVANPKMDGIWISMFGGKQLTLVSRNGQQKPSGNLHTFPGGSLIVGEYGYGQEESTKRKAALGHDFVDVFDILFYNNKWLGNKALLERYDILKHWHNKLWANAQKHYIVLPMWTSNFVDEYRKQHEGLILKKINGRAYIPGTRDPEWIKFKKAYDYDYVLMDWEQSTAATKSNIPMVKNLILGLYINGKLTPVGKCGSMDHATSIELAANFDKYKGKVIIVKGNGQFDSGACRHPAFVKFRDDKKATECIWKLK